VVADGGEAAGFVRGDGHIGWFADVGIEVDLERFDEEAVLRGRCW